MRETEFLTAVDNDKTIAADHAIHWKIEGNIGWFDLYIFDREKEQAETILGTVISTPSRELFDKLEASHENED